jgi:hypothetical protein
MAEEQAAPRGGSILRMLIFAGIIILIAAIAALLVFRFVLQPMLNPPEEIEVPADQLPATMVTVNFSQDQVSVIPDDPDMPTPILIYEVAMACNIPEALTIIDANKAWFSSMLSDLHQYKTKEELNDPLVKESIQRQAQQKANDLLKRLAPALDVRVIKVMHTRYFVYDP